MSGFVAAARPKAGRRGDWLKRGMRRIRRGHRADAFASTAQVAREDDVAGQMALGMDYLHGRTVPRSIAAAALWFRRAAAGGQAGAMVHLAKFALAGELSANEGSLLFGAQHQRTCFEDARFWAQRAEAAGSPEGKTILAALLTQGPAEWCDPDGAQAHLEQAVEAGCAAAALSLAIHHARNRSADPQSITMLLRAAADAGSKAASYLLGVALEMGAGCERDMVAAVTCYRRSAKQGFVWAQIRLGCALIEGIGTGQNRLTGISCLREAAKGGNAAAAALLGNFYARASNEVNYLEAGYWFLRAAELGDAPSARIASFLHLTGIGLHEDRRDVTLCLQRAETMAMSVVTADTDPAEIIAGDRADLCARIDVRNWFAPLAGSGDTLAAYRLGVCYAMGIGGERDDVRAAECLTHAALRMPQAQLLYGQLLLDERSPKCDPVKGRAWVHRAAGSGLQDARVAMAELLANGRGGPRDEAAALQLFTEAAWHGHPGAMYAVGALHGGGHGIEPDRPLALRWFRRAAVAGHGRAQLMLGRYLAGGIGGDRDCAEAATWFRRAVGNGIGEAGRDLAALV